MPPDNITIIKTSISIEYLNVPIHFSVNGICHTKVLRNASGSTVSDVAELRESLDHLLESVIIVLREYKLNNNGTK